MIHFGRGVLYEGGTWACICDMLHTMCVADTYLDGMSGATVYANALGRGGHPEYCHRDDTVEREAGNGQWLGKSWRGSNWTRG